MTSLEVTRIPNYEFPFGIKKDIFIIKLNGKSLAIPNLYLRNCSEYESEDTVRNKASHLKSFFGRLLTDHNESIGLSSGIDDPNNYWYMSANTVFRKTTCNYMSGYLLGLANGRLSPSGKPISNKSLKFYVATFKGFFDFCYQKGFLAEKAEFTYRLPNQEKITTASVGLDEAVHDLFYEKEDFKKVIGYVQTKHPFLKARDLLALKLTYFMGLRPHEIYKAGNFAISRLKDLIKKDASFNASCGIRISGKGKGFGKIRDVIFTPEVYNELREFIYITIPKFEKKSGLKVKDSIFIKLNGENFYGKKQLSQRVWRGAVNSYIAAQELSMEEIKCWKKRNLYSARHCFATNLIIDRMREGKRIDQITVKMLMGHKEFTTTLASYIYIGAVRAQDEKLQSTAIGLYENASKRGWFND